MAKADNIPELKGYLSGFVLTVLNFEIRIFHVGTAHRAYLRRDSGFVLFISQDRDS